MLFKKQKEYISPQTPNTIPEQKNEIAQKTKYRQIDETKIPRRSNNK